MNRNIIISFLFIALGSCSNIDNNKKEGISKKTIEKGVVVKVTIISSKQFYREIIANGKVFSKFKSEINFNAADKLTAIKVRNGQKVVKGQLLASIENSLLKNNLEKTNIALKKALNKLTEEKINFGSENITFSVLKNLEVKSGVLEAKNNLERAQIEYNQTVLKAPFSGVIANIEKKQGDFITSSDAFCTIINPNTLEVTFSVLENEFEFISKEQEVRIEPFANKDKVYKGIIAEINPVVDKNGLIKIKATVSSKKTGLLDGMHVKVIITQPLKDVIVIPKEALVLRSNREVVFTLENSLAKWNYVEIAGENTNSYAIKKGLKLTDTIIVSGNLNLSHDAKVNAAFVNNETTSK